MTLKSSIIKIIAPYFPWLVITSMGVCWGLTFSLAKIATGAGGSAFGIAFWQAAISALIVYCFSLSRNPFQFPKSHLRLIVAVALLGAAIPNVLFFLAASHVPAGVLAITTALVPGVTYALAIPMRILSKFWADLFWLKISKTSLFIISPYKDKSAIN